MIAFHPDDLLTVPLACGDDVPEAERPALRCRAMSIQEHREYRRLLESARVAATDDEAVDLYKRALGLTLRGWINVSGDDGAPVPYTTDALDRLTYLRLRALAEMLPRELVLQEADSFTSPLLRPSAKANSAPAAATGDASTPRA